MKNFRGQHDIPDICVIRVVPDPNVSKFRFPFAVQAYPNFPKAK